MTIDPDILIAQLDDTPDDVPPPEPDPDTLERWAAIHDELRRPPQRTAAPTTDPGGSIPYDDDIERAVISAMMLGGDRDEYAHPLVTALVPEHFYRPLHGDIWAAISAIRARGEPVDPLGVAAELGVDTEQRAELAALQADSSGYPSTLPRNAGYLLQLHHRRRVLYASADLGEAARTGQGIAHAVDKVTDAHTSVTGAPLWVDMGAVLDGDLEAPEPTLLARQDGRRLLYPAAINGVFGPPANGKTWVALAAATAALDNGWTVIYLDHEDTARNIASRLLALGADPASIRDRLKYAAIETALSDLDRATIIGAAGPDTLFTLDGVASSIAQAGYSEDSNTEVDLWASELVRPVARRGATVLTLDHVTKDKDGRSWARGAGHKLALVDGVAYRIAGDPPPSRTREGKLVLTVAKDRHGGVGTMDLPAAILYVRPEDTAGRRDTTIAVPNETDRGPADREREKLTSIDRQIIATLADQPGQTSRDLRSAVKGRNTDITDRLHALTDAQVIVRETQDTTDGRGRARPRTVYRLAPDFDPAGPVPVPSPGTRSDSGPEAGPGSGPHTPEELF